jgi:hypothetical protein
LNESQVALQGQGRIFAWPMEGCHKDTKFHSGCRCHRLVLPLCKIYWRLVVAFHSNTALP